MEKLYGEFNTIVNERKKEEKEVDKDTYPWLDDSDKRKYMTGQGDIRKTYKFGHLMPNRVRKNTSKRYDL